ncbi:MAG: nuclear transport factor 2 family protein [Janthinobacterium lividum]
MNLHQQYIDNDASRASALKYVDLYWPEGRMTVNDVRHVTFSGPDELKRMYDYAHSVFPIHKWSHDMGPFSITGSDTVATSRWRWIVNWRREVRGGVSTGIYTDRWEKRDGLWKCLERTSDIDENWPLELFQPYVDRESELFRES